MTTPEPGRRILVVAQHSVHQPAYGGAEVYLRNLAEELPRHEYFGLVMTNRRFGAEYRLQRLASGEDLHTFHLGRGAEVPYDALSDNGLDGVLEQAIAVVRPDLVLINSLIGFSLTALHVLEDLGIPYVLIHHDYFALCDQPTLLDSDTGRFCGIEAPGHPRCGDCARARFPQGYRFRGARVDIRERRGIMRRAMMRARTNIVNLPSVRRIIAEGAGMDEEQFTVVRPSRRHIPNRARALKPHPTGSDGGLHIAIQGVTFPHKGAVLIRQAMEQLASEAVHWHFFGDVDPDIAAAANHRVHRHGRYHSILELPSGLSDCHLALVASPWPETYCYFLDEAVASGLVPLVRRSLTLAERCLPSYSFAFGDIESLVHTIRFAASHKEAISERRAALPAHWDLNPETFADQMSPILAPEGRGPVRVAETVVSRSPSHSLQMALGEVGVRRSWGRVFLNSWIPPLEGIRRLAEQGLWRLRRFARRRAVGQA